MSNIRDWRAQVSEWERAENATEILHRPSTFAANLTKVKIRVCAKCGTHEGLIHRHHKGHEFLWARLLPKEYARRYVEFRKTDIVFLCEKNKCHLKIHKLYEPRLHELWPLLASQDGVITHKQAERFRQKLVRCCNNWLRRKKRHVK